VSINPWVERRSTLDSTHAPTTERRDQTIIEA